MRIEVEPAVLERFGVVRIGLLCGHIDAARGDLDAGIEELRAASLNGLLACGLDANTLIVHPHIAEWRTTYERFGVKVRSHRPTHEALARRVLRDGKWPGQINPIVDVYLTNQLTHLLPHGGYDCEPLAGTLRLAVSSGGEPFEPLGGGAETTEVGEIIYRDDCRVLTRRWNSCDCDTTKITADTRQFVLMLESAGTLISDEALGVATADLRDRYERLWTGRFTSRVERLTHEHASFSLDETRSLS
jgi:DNA/RNA-binding domain of Phe-tRNA-synthetase-like protein